MEEWKLRVYLAGYSKDLEYRKKWNILDNDLRAKCLKEKGFTVMPLVIVGIF